MRAYKLSSIFLITALFMASCAVNPQEETYIEPDQTGISQGAAEYDQEERWARENLDLRAVGALLEKAQTAEEFEHLLNDRENGVNNLDLNGDGYADYISVREFDDRYDDERGFSLFSMFGPNEIQEIATIIFDREGVNYPGSRVLINGNEQIYGDNYNYETNWLNRVVPIVSWLFNDRDDYYRSPYYYENYPDYYEPYEIVETPIYRTRIERYIAQPVFIQTEQPSFTEIKIKSPNRDKSLDKIYSKLAKPNKNQVEFEKNNPGPPEFVREKKLRQKDFSVKESKSLEDYSVKPDKPEKRFKREKSDKFERKIKFEKPEQPKFERQNKQKFEKPDKQQKQENKGGGNGKGNGGGKDKSKGKG